MNNSDKQKRKDVNGMSLLRSYSFGHVLGVTELPVDVLNLFLCLGENPDKKIEFASEIISAGLQGNINFNSEFNIDGYEAAIRKNTKLGKEDKRKKEVFLDFSDNTDDWEATQRAGGIKVDVASASMTEKMKDAYEELILEDELRYAVETIKSLQPTLLVEAKIDFIHTVKKALKGIPESIRLLKKVCEEYEVVAEQVMVILSSGYTFEEIFS